MTGGHRGRLWPACRCRGTGPTRVGGGDTATGACRSLARLPRHDERTVRQVGVRDRRCSGGQDAFPGDLDVGLVGEEPGEAARLLAAIRTAPPFRNARWRVRRGRSLPGAGPVAAEDDDDQVRRSRRFGDLARSGPAPPCGSGTVRGTPRSRRPGGSGSARVARRAAARQRAAASNPTSARTAADDRNGVMRPTPRQARTGSRGPRRWPPAAAARRRGCTGRPRTAGRAGRRAPRPAAPPAPGPRRW